MLEMTFDDKQVLDALNRLARAGEELSPAMQEISGALEAGIEEAFKKERAPDGTKWRDLSEVTTARRAKRHKWPGPILQISGHLAGAITSDYDAFSAVAGTNLRYAKTHQQGAQRGAFGTTCRGTPIPWGDIPARPFLGVSAKTREGMIEAINKHFADALG